MTSTKRDFLKFTDFSYEEHQGLFRRAKVLKDARRKRRVVRTMAGRTLTMIFEKASTRTRLSFEAAMLQLGGSCIDLSASNSQMSRGEPLADTARVTGRYCDVVMMRTFADARLEEFAAHCEVPVINGLTDGGHPVQILTDLFTIEERLGSVKGKTLAFIGDTASNMGRSFTRASSLFGFQLKLASPEGYHPSADVTDTAKGFVHLVRDPKEAVKGADAVITDVWTSMGQEAESAKRLKDLGGYQVNPELMKLAAPHALFLHCLPAHREEEVTASVIDGPQSVVWDEAENRMHVQKALLEFLVLENEKRGF
ncbi:MAG: ornithine carbamoyltransferase [Archangium gephyra]|uniref:Ornithine carbamoyltransferase n=1 Tax=Archangium gephyra TaxID=48 RepID=A0A2W5SQ87_9BACT|nr:MAG: ornithine carbamoyltransferase [Archangium gephyra]